MMHSIISILNDNGHITYFKCHYMELPKYSDVVDLPVPVPRKKSRDTWRDEHAVPL